MMAEVIPCLVLFCGWGGGGAWCVALHCASQSLKRSKTIVVDPSRQPT